MTRLITGVLIMASVTTVIIVRTPLLTNETANDDGNVVAAGASEPPREELVPPPRAGSALKRPQVVAEPQSLPLSAAVVPAASLPQTVARQETTNPPVTVSKPEPRTSAQRTSTEQRGMMPLRLESSESPERPKFIGTISIESPVVGADVHIDGKLIGATPLADWQLAAGSHVVRVELGGYSRWSTVVQIVAGKNVSLIANLEPIERK